MLKSGIKR